jgi:metallo-beta-lactamase class B
MRNRIQTALIAAAALATAAVWAQPTTGTKDAHLEAARKAAGDEHIELFKRICLESQAVENDSPPAASSAQPGRGPTPAAGATPRQTPPRERWYMEPSRVFDNLYFVGTREHGAWAVVGSEGIIIIDALYDYAVEAAVVGGLEKLALDPARIRYVIVSHGHGDHHGGAKLLQDRFGARLVMGADDWALVERDARNPRPKRDIVATDGMRIAVGDASVTLHLTPGHTLGTISTLIPVKDGARSHVAASWGGTSFSASTPREQMNLYVNSAIRFRELAAKAGADVLIGNHTRYDGTVAKTAALRKRPSGGPHPYVIGKDAVGRYLTVAEECARAELAGS